MNRRRVLVFAGIVFAPFLALGAACSFPDVTYGTPDGSPDGLGPNETSASDTGANHDGSSTDGSTEGSTDAGQPPIFDGSLPEADTTDSATVDANGCSAHPRCDCDEDGYKANDCDASAAELDAALKEGDCDDLNAARNPAAGPHMEVTENGDWNCDGHVTKTPPGKMTTCTASGLKCQSSYGFLDDPECGTQIDPEFMCASTFLGGVITSCPAPQQIEPTQTPVVFCQ